jgi:hypothetical protein
LREFSRKRRDVETKHVDSVGASADRKLSQIAHRKRRRGPNRSIAARETRKPPSTPRLSSSSRAAVFMTSPLKTMARLISPISPTITGPKCRLPRIRGATPNSRSNWLDARASSSRIATKQRSGRQSTAPLRSGQVTITSSPT